MEHEATLYRMVMPEHTCPYGLKAKNLLERQHFRVNDRWLTTRAETDHFKSEHQVKTTPQIFIGAERVGGYDDLRRYFGKKVIDKKAVTYRPVAMLFLLAALMTLAASSASGWHVPRLARWFVGFSMTLLALQKLQDVESFSSMFLNYDLLAKRWVPYSYVYSYAEAAAGILMIAGTWVYLTAGISLFIGGVGAVSVLKAVYVDKRELKCACVGGASNVPLGFVSLAENLMMVGMAVWMLASRLRFG